MILDLEKLAWLDRRSTIVVFSVDQRDELRQRIADELGNEKASQATMVVIDDRDKAIAHLAGRQPPIYIDPRWYGEVDGYLRQMVESYVDHANAMPFPPKLHRTTTRF